MAPFWFSREICNFNDYFKRELGRGLLFLKKPFYCFVSMGEGGYEKGLNPFPYFLNAYDEKIGFEGR